MVQALWAGLHKGMRIAAESVYLSFEVYMLNYRRRFTVISVIFRRLSKGTSERLSILDLILEAINYCSQNSWHVRDSWRCRWRWSRWFGQDRNRSFFSVLADSPLPDMFFLRHRGWWRLSFNDCIKRWRWSRYFTSLAAWNALYNTRVLDYCLQRKFEPWFKIIFRSVRTSSRSSCTPKDIANKKLYSEELWSFGNVPSVFCKHGSFFCFVFWTT